MANVVDINGKQCDLSNAFPLLLGDFRKLMQMGIDVNNLDSDMLANLDFMELIIKKCNPEITTDDFNSMTPAVFSDISNKIKELTETTNDTGNSAPLDAG